MVADGADMVCPEGGDHPLPSYRCDDGRLSRCDDGVLPRGPERWECAGLALGAVGRGAARPGVQPPLYQESDGAGRVHYRLVSGDGGDLAPIIACEFHWLSRPDFLGHRHAGWNYIRSNWEERPHAYGAWRSSSGYGRLGPGAWRAVGEGFEVGLRPFHPRWGACHLWRGIGRLGMRPSGWVAASSGWG